MSILPIKEMRMDRSSHMHRSTGNSYGSTLSTDEESQQVPQWISPSVDIIFCRTTQLLCVSWVQTKYQLWVHLMYVDEISNKFKFTKTSSRLTAEQTLHFNSSIVSQTIWISHVHNNSVTHSDVYNSFLVYRVTPKLLQTSKLSP